LHQQILIAESCQVGDGLVFRQQALRQIAMAALFSTVIRKLPSVS
jgi:hypothetical protein